MPAKLALYHKKRDFHRTTEPRGALNRRAGSLYLIQKHAARRLHYDFRLEMDGVLKSWAVPKGPSLDPADRRLAVHVEDHPVEYGSFEGVIPKPGYGAGTVMLWDTGTWLPEGNAREDYRRGKLKFTLRGKRLKGRWALIRMHGRDGDKNWLLKKEREEGASPRGQPVEIFDTSVVSGLSMEQIAKGKKPRIWRSRKNAESPAPKSDAPESAHAGVVRKSREPVARPAPFPRLLHPQLATLVDQVPSGDGWLHEMKFDGYRLLAFLRHGRCRLLTRNAKDWTGKFPSIAKAVEKLSVQDAVIDGEVVVQNKDGSTDFQSLQNFLQGDGAASLLYYVFDLPYLNGHDLSLLPLLKRKEALEALVKSKANSPVRFSRHFLGHGNETYKSACSHSLEGIISKRVDSPYLQERSDHWVKVKCVKRQEFVIGGFTEPKGSRQHLGSLLVGAKDSRGNLRYRGHVGTGFNAKTLATLYKAFQKITADRSPFSGPIEDKLRRVVHWVQPRLVGEVEFIGWTEDGLLRHPSFLGLREDKKPAEVGIEKTKPLSDVAQPRRRASMDAEAGDAVSGVTLTHPDRILYPEQNVTKRDLARYLEKMAPLMLPHLKNRPVTLVRCPQGRGKACFYQKHPTDMPEHMRTVAIQESTGKNPYLLVDDTAGLVSLAQMSVLEIHLWGSSTEHLERPDRLVFDLDPAEDVPWAKTILAAKRCRDKLEKMGLTSFLKTTGGKGLHVVVPIAPDLPWDAVKLFTQAVAQSLSNEHPGEYVTRATKSLRAGKIFIDYLRNGRGATSVCPFSPRAKPAAPVSYPIHWSDLSPKIRPDQFTINSLQSQSKPRRDPWEGFFNLKQRLPRDVRKHFKNARAD